MLDRILDGLLRPPWALAAVFWIQVLANGLLPLQAAAAVDGIALLAYIGLIILDTIRSQSRNRRH